jgi:LysR family carnitine catabolism transcriptional activator
MSRHLPVYCHFSMLLSVKQMNLSLRQIEVFLAVARTMSFSEAARMCHLSQPALSANVKRLEETLGARLFERHTRKVSLTALGTEFLAIATGMTENIHLSLGRMNDFVSGKRGRLVIAAAPSMAASLVPGLIADYSVRHPDIELELHDALSDVCLEMVRGGVADIALAAFKPDATEYDQRELFRDPLVMICPLGHPLAQRPLVRWRDVQAFPHVVMNRSSSLRQLIDAQYARYGIPLRPAFEVAHVGTMLGLIAANLGVGELPESLIHNIDMKGLAHRRISDKAAYRRICAITLRNRAQAPPLPPFLELCRSHAIEWSIRRDSALGKV